MKLAFVGLGNMGLPMAVNLVKANYETFGINRSKKKEEIFAESGGIVGDSLVQVAQEVDVIMTCLPLPSDVERVYLGEEGIIANGKRGLILIDFSTVSPDINEKIYNEAKKKGIDFLDAPISGGNEGARLGTLSIMVGGDKKVFDKVYPIFEVLGQNIFYTGKVGNGTVIKLINQYMVSVHTQAVSEALCLAEKNGIAFETLFEILNNSYAQSRIYERHYTQHISKEEYKPGFALKLLYKDISLVQKMAEKNTLTLPLGNQVEELLKEAKDSVFQDDDMSAMYLFMREQAK
ncbi:NAD(P)-dependent oxidoreductase [Scopulibacillus cellulosilyticus]|uniref:NAD(P)-dependent oxidoreductase n=1 Tax=Scopulibacillus cellulosilyticus TaxID=2665665 RepID=A0ABW2Q0U9_9BACL